MFSLIISIIAIALAAVLLLTSAFYGGDALTEGTAKAQAASLANEAQQITAGFDLHKVENNGAEPADVAELVTDEYLKQAPATGWVLDLTTDIMSTPATVSDDVCGYVTANSAVNGLLCDAAGGDANTVSFQM